MKIFLQSLDSGYERSLREGFAFLGNSGRIRPSDRVTIKPNLTFPCYRQGVVTNPEAIEAVVAYVKEFTSNIIICESDSGGYNPFSMTDAFARIGINDIAKRYGARVVNLSHERSRTLRFRAGLKRLSVPLPELILDHTDLFITMPVPKVHVNAIISCALKNQWGVIQEPALRLKLHPYLKTVIYDITKALPRSLAVVDGKYGLTRSGPLKGDALDLNWVALGDNLFAIDFLIAELMGFDYRHIPYLRWIFKQERLSSLDHVEFNTDYKAFKSPDFYLERQWTDIPGLMTFKMRALAYVGYESVLAKSLHWLLYRFREPFY